MITPQVIKEYLDLHYSKNHRIVKSGQEFTINSIFTQDYKFHLSINLDTGLWRCFKSGKQGNFVQFVAFNEGITTKQAFAKLTLRSLELGVNIFSKPERQVRKSPTYKFDEFIEENKLVKLGEGHEIDFLATPFLERRGSLHKHFNFYLGVEGPLTARLIIPYVLDNTIFFYQARGLIDSMKPKYLNDTRFKASSILFPFDYEKDHVYVVEGPLDAISLQALGYNATSLQGSYISKEQWSHLRSFGGRIIFAFDNDEAGKAGLNKALDGRAKNRIPEKKVFYCNPPNIYKDWNEAFISNKETIKIACEDIIPASREFKIYSILNNL